MGFFTHPSHFPVPPPFHHTTSLALPYTTLQVVSLHCNLDDNTRHLINKNTLKLMKPEAVLVNAARGPCINEADLVAHLQQNPNFRVGLDVFEFEPAMVEGLEKCDNAVIVPHIASASFWTRSGMVCGCWGRRRGRLKGNLLVFVDGLDV